MADTSMAYIAKKSCGCLSMAIVDTPEHKIDVAKEISKAVRLGETIERVTIDVVRTMDWECPEHKGEANG